MRLEIPIDVVARAKKSGCDNPNLIDAPEYGYNGPDGGDQYVVVSSLALKASDMATLGRVVDSKIKLKSSPRLSALYRKLKSLDEIGRSTNVKIKGLEALAVGILKLLSTLPHHWVFKEDKQFKRFIPCLVYKCWYEPPHYQSGGGMSAPYVGVACVGMSRGKQMTMSESLERWSYPAEGITPEEALFKMGFMVENEEMVEEYHASFAEYNRLRSVTGLQLLTEGRGILIDNEEDDDGDKYGWRWYSSEKLILIENDNGPDKAVVDDIDGWKEEDGTKRLEWANFENVKQSRARKNKGSRDAAEEAEENSESSTSRPIPVWPIMRVFDLRLHRFVMCHVDQCEKYVYNPSVFDMIVLPDEHRQIMDMLVFGENADGGDDIIAGKGKSAIILAYGPPGTGKTLTAETYSEKTSRPLYSVQCSQLGVDVKEIESNLMRILKNARRWHAVLSMDEADVYLTERGSDIQQNAIVGVFLRVLEYYSGIMFLTTNVEGKIDDAILSRAAVIVRYRIPEAEARLKIWTILVKQFQLDITPVLLKQVAETHTLTGRGIKQLIRMAKRWNVTYKKPLTLDVFKMLLNFHEMALSTLNKRQ